MLTNYRSGENMSTPTPSSLIAIQEKEDEFSE